MLYVYNIIMTKKEWHTADHEYKGYFIWNSSYSNKIVWQVEPIGDANTPEFWEKRNAIPELKTLKQIYRWIDKKPGENK